MTKYKKGFTLIELLVVIAIIGVLASIVLASLDSSRKKGRDARRLADIKQIQLALEVYYDQNNSFPGSISTAQNSCGSGVTCAQQNLINPGYISNVPTDPSGTNRDYNYVGYALTGGGTIISYHLGADLETQGHQAFQTDADAPQQAAGSPKYFPNTASDFDGADMVGGSPHKCNNLDAGVECYDVTP